MWVPEARRRQPVPRSAISWKFNGKRCKRLLLQCALAIPDPYPVIFSDDRVRYSRPGKSYKKSWSRGWASSTRHWPPLLVIYGIANLEGRTEDLSRNYRVNAGIWAVLSQHEKHCKLTGPPASRLRILMIASLIPLMSSTDMQAPATLYPRIRNGISKISKTFTHPWTINHRSYIILRQKLLCF